MSVFEFRLKHDPNDRIIEKQETVAGRSVTWKYSYDKEGRLFEAHLELRRCPLILFLLIDGHHVLAICKTRV
nr:hypothetical protein [uncultured Pseudodesulfovibrio sp.]